MSAGTKLRPCTELQAARDQDRPLLQGWAWVEGVCPQSLLPLEAQPPGRGLCQALLQGAPSRPHVARLAGSKRRKVRAGPGGVFEQDLAPVRVAARPSGVGRMGKMGRIFS